ncbi:N-terminal domain of peptidoglycan hydrolase CwlO-containing protein [Gracilibacillus ureilyticus]|uniref:N-terminal domain of peptidoglycan hydrolase CwlO-containing protein n=2 Tax=Gracilibacillus ureilyticus TaxID=531814 RepID=A0A1H9S314_9BACI|nr:N-terminal domain of peptidoglycan hydrolase CwlO-containing protein [Gracilibacillus ureilyticus]
MKQTAVTATVVTSLFFVHNHSVQAETQEEIQAQRSELQTNIETKQSEIDSIKEELITLTEKLNRLEEAIKDNEKVMQETEGNITKVESEVEDLEAEIEELQKDIDRRNEILKERISSMQQSGGTNSYLEVLFGATNFLDFIDRYSLVTKITSADQELLDAQEADKQKLEENKVTLDSKLAELEEMAVEYEAIQKQIVAQKEENEEVKEELERKQEANKDILADLQIEDEILAKKEKALEEAKKQQQLLQSQPAGNVSSGSGNSTVSNQSAPASNSGTAVASGNLQTIINAGNKYIGNSVYVFGGGRNAYDIANGRFDCSGFVSWAFSQGGVSLPASTSAMSGVGTQVSTSEMKPGDLVFFNTYKTNGHVGIYLGNNKFIGSQNSTGVAVADMGSGYWANTFSGHVRRVVQ